MTFAGADWRATPRLAGQMFEAFAVMRHLHELLWYVSAALAMPRASPLHDGLRVARDTTERLTELDADSLVGFDVEAHRRDINTLLQAASALVRADVAATALDRRGADLAGADLRDAELVGANFRGAVLIAAQLTGANLSLADLTGADLRDADVCGADLSTSLFLTQSQLDAAKGDDRTRFPSWLNRPAHWSFSAA